MHIIAEACCNHIGDRRIMESMIKALSAIGVDTIKFQSFDANKLRKDWPNYDEAFLYYAKHELSDGDHKWLIQKCKEYNIGFLTTVFDLDTVKFLKSIGVKEVKIASPDCNNWDLVDACLDAFYRVYISVGMHTDDEVMGLVTYLKTKKAQNKVTLLHCVSEYPTSLDKVNMAKLQRIKDFGFQAGFSDHTLGTDACKMAIAMGADIIEKHFTLSRYLPGKDQIISGTIEEFQDIVEWRNLCKIMKGNNSKWPDKPEDIPNRHYIGRWNGV